MSKAFGKPHPLVITLEDCRALAQYLAVEGVRNNTDLEQLHSGTTPSSKKGDYSDVKVVSPYGPIPWNELSRFGDEEMRALMLSIEAALEKALVILMHLDEKQKEDFLETVRRSYDDPNWEEYMKKYGAK